MPRFPVRATPAPVVATRAEGRSSVVLPEEEIDSLALVSLEFSLERESLESLEAAVRYLTDERLATTFDGDSGLLEAAVLRTCHRVELYLWAEGAPAVDAGALALLPLGSKWRRREGIDTIRHLFRVASGLESMAVGEREVREQVRSASARVLTRSPRPVLRPLLLAAVEAADGAAPDVPAGRSMAAIAAARVLEESPQPFPRVLVAGVGTIGRQVTELLGSSCRVALAYRTRPPDDGFLRSVGARAVPWASLRDELAVSDVLVSAAKSADRLFPPDAVRGRTAPLLVIDLGVPRNVDPALREQPGIRLIDVAELRPNTRATPAPGVEAAIERGVAKWSESLRAWGIEVWIDQLRRSAEARRRALVEQAGPYLGPLTERQQEAVETLTRRVVAELLDGASRGLRAMPPGPEGDALRRWALRWFGPGPDRA